MIRKLFLTILLLNLIGSFCYADEFELPLKQGFNFVSLPLNLSNPSIDGALSSIDGKYSNIWLYDNTNPQDPWKHYHHQYISFSDLENINSGLSYWIEADEDCTLSVTGSLITTPLTLNLTEGWNSFGWPYLESQSVQNALYNLIKNTDFARICRFNPQNKTFEEQFDSFDAGYGYYIYALRNCQINFLPLPELSIEISKFNDPIITISGKMNQPGDVDINGESLPVGDDGTFKGDITVPQGQDKVTVIATNQAGNSVSTIIDLKGTLVPITGGEVTSSDGKVKLIIPPAALLEPTYIRLTSIDRESLREDALPEEYTALGIVQCEPSGLKFQKNAQLVYILDEAQDQGTLLRLGLYNPQEDRIKFTEEGTLIGEDPHAVTFNILGFSTYAALKHLTPSSGAPIGSGVQIPLPDMFTGAFSHSVALTVPPGRKNLQPNLQLIYRSSNPNSWLGVGFSLNPGYIVRSTRLGPPTYLDDKDTFCLITDAGSTELVHVKDNLYQARIESDFTMFFKEGDYWRVAQKDGTVLYFGQSAESKEAGLNNTTNTTFSWQLNKVIDTNGNYIQYNYIKDEGKAYLSSIEYTGNEKTGFSPMHKVGFFLEGRDDAFSNYISSIKINTAKRLKRVEVKINNALVWKYELEYIYSSDTGRSLLKSIRQFGKDGKAFPAQTFKYQSAQK
ncbi:MAG: hypothetical protein JSV30_02210 [Candidatus Omnitrophota bacterium]|nr:MAG: hypothetical protein JSV30_02210 [Candidatus Omnitrophota bacterium]